MTTLRQARHSHFQRGSAVFTCACCDRRTRVTNQGNDRICSECYDLAGETNSLSDTGELYDKNAVDILNRCVERGGSVKLLLKEFPEVCEHLGWTGPTAITTEATEEKEIKVNANFIVKISSKLGLRFEAPVAAADPKAAVKLARSAVKEAGISRRVGTINYRVVLA